jgi:hypothetical protein
MRSFSSTRKVIALNLRTPNNQQVRGLGFSIAGGLAQDPSQSEGAAAHPKAYINRMTSNILRNNLGSDSVIDNLNVSSQPPQLGPGLEKS